MASKYPTATIAFVELVPGLPIEGLMTEDAEFFVAVTQFSARFSVGIKNETITLKRLLGGAFQSVQKLKTPLNPKAVNCLPLEQYQLAVVKLAIKGNPLATNELELSTALGYQKAFCLAFNIKFGQEEVSEFLKIRYEGIQQRNHETDAIKSYMDSHPELSDNDRRWMYPNTTDDTYRIVFGRRARDMYPALAHLGADPKLKNLRDFLPATGLENLKDIEKLAGALIVKNDIHPRDAVAEAARRLMVEPVEIQD